MKLVRTNMISGNQIFFKGVFDYEKEKVKLHKS